MFCIRLCCFVILILCIVLCSLFFVFWFVLFCDFKFLFKHILFSLVLFSVLNYYVPFCLIFYPVFFPFVLFLF